MSRVQLSRIRTNAETPIFTFQVGSRNICEKINDEISEFND